MNKTKIFSWLFLIVYMFGIAAWIFYETGHVIRYVDVRESVLNAHETDWAAVVWKYHFPVLVTISFYANVIALKAFNTFRAWVSSGKIRVGGKASGD